MAERVKCKPPKKIRIARAEPVKKIEPQTGSDQEAEPDDELAFKPLVDLVDHRSPTPSPSPPPVKRSFVEPDLDSSSRPRRQPKNLDVEPDVDLDALKDKYRPKKAAVKPLQKVAKPTNAKPEPTPGTILLKPPTPPVEEIKVEPITPTYVEMKRPLSK